MTYYLPSHPQTELIVPALTVLSLLGAGAALLLGDRLSLPALVRVVTVAALLSVVLAAVIIVDVTGLCRDWWWWLCTPLV